MTNKNKIINDKSFNYHNFGYFGQSKWIKSDSPVEYDSAIEWMTNRVNKIQSNQEMHNSKLCMSCWCGSGGFNPPLRLRAAA